MAQNLAEGKIPEQCPAPQWVHCKETVNKVCAEAIRYSGLSPLCLEPGICNSEYKAKPEDQVAEGDKVTVGGQQR